MTNANLMSTNFPPKSLLCYEAYSFQERREGLCHYALVLKVLYFRLSLVKRERIVLSIFRNKNLGPFKFNELESINVSL